MALTLRHVLSLALLGTLHCSSSGSTSPGDGGGGATTDTAPADDGSSSSSNDAADGGVVGEGTAPEGSAPDAGARDAGDGSIPFNPDDWASWPMPNSAVDVEAGAPNPEQYVAGGNGTVTDQVTGLVWTQTAASGSYSLPSAEAYCTSLQLAGAHDWRLPTYVELVSLEDYTQSPSITAMAFPGISAGTTSFVSSTLWAAAIHVRTVEYNWGTTTIDRPDNTFGVLCVRAGKKATAQSRYTTATDTVTDNQTLLTWQRKVSTSSYTWAEAKTYCSGLSDGGTSGWRLPTVKELVTLVDATQLATVDLTVFPNIISGTFWSSTPFFMTSPPQAWAVDFTGSGTFDSQAGDVFNQGVTAGGQVRCVK